MRGFDSVDRFGGLYDDTVLDRGLKLKDRLYDIKTHLLEFEFKQAMKALDDFVEDYDSYMVAVDNLETMKLKKKR